MRGTPLAFVIAALVVSGGCSSGSGSAPQTTGGGINCGSLCQKILAAHCPNDSQGECMADCQSSTQQFAQCSSAYGAYLDCFVASAPITCDSDGKATIGTNQSSLYSSCQSELLAVSGCAACQIDAKDSAATQCLKTTCCAELKAAATDPAVPQVLQCQDQCTDSACDAACFDQYPSLNAKIAAELSCQQSNCQ
jgi:hypothetical protein